MSAREVGVRGGPLRRVGALARAFAVICWLLGSATACRGEATNQPAPASSAPRPVGLGPLVVREDTANLLLTYVDTAGDFHVVQRPADVPIDARDQVRVVVTTREDGTGDQVYVADLRARQPDGTYAVRTMSRAQWDELGATRRKARLEALVPPPSAAVSAQPPVAGSAARREVPVVAVIYGAEWCKPCHDAARYLKSRGVTVIEKDIESSDAVKQEMDRKLERAKLNGASIPIIDVGGRLLIGFSPQALDRAVEAARSRRTL